MGQSSRFLSDIQKKFLITVQVVDPNRSLDVATPTAVGDAANVVKDENELHVDMEPPKRAPPKLGQRRPIKPSIY